LVVRNGSGVMLAGDSFAGKSTLAYACARTGWTYVSDDGAFVVRGRDDRYAVGDPHSIRFRPDAPDLFPELADRMPTIRPNGKVAIEILTGELMLETAPGCNVDHVVYLNRRPRGKARLRHFSKERMREEWLHYATFGTRETRAAQGRCHERMLSAQLWEMQYSDLDDAVARLERLIDGGM
jgi:serine kinase of HPr protein (carbohydrate metabolism regulator)